LWGGGNRPCSPPGPSGPPGGPGSGGPSSPTTSAVSRWLESAFRDSSPPSSPIGPTTPNSEISFGEGNSFWTAMSPLSALGEVEEGRHSGLLGVGDGAGNLGGVQDIGGGVELLQNIGVSQFA